MLKSGQIYWCVKGFCLICVKCIRIVGHVWKESTGEEWFTSQNASNAESITSWCHHNVLASRFSKCHCTIHCAQANMSKNFSGYKSWKAVQRYLCMNVQVSKSAFINISNLVTTSSNNGLSHVSRCQRCHDRLVPRSAAWHRAFTDPWSARASTMFASKPLLEPMLFDRIMRNTFQWRFIQKWKDVFHVVFETVFSKIGRVSLRFKYVDFVHVWCCINVCSCIFNLT